MTEASREAFFYAACTTSKELVGICALQLGKK
jgi:hypothetical protein